MNKTQTSAQIERIEVTIDWKRGNQPEPPGEFPLEHQWQIDGQTLTVVERPPPKGHRPMVEMDPLQAYVATIASDHMLEWLDTAFELGAEVHSYRDRACGVLSRLSEGEGTWVSEVILRPQVSFGPRMGMTPEAIARAHELALEGSYIASSVKTKIKIAGA